MGRASLRRCRQGCFLQDEVSHSEEPVRQNERVGSSLGAGETARQLLLQRPKIQHCYQMLTTNRGSDGLNGHLYSNAYTPLCTQRETERQRRRDRHRETERDFSLRSTTGEEEPA